MLPPTVVRDMPWGSGQLITSSMDSDMLSGLGEALGRVWPWLKANTGPDGMFMGTQALNLRFEKPSGLTPEQFALSTVVPDAKSVYLQAINSGMDSRKARRLAYVAAILKGADASTAQITEEQLSAQQFTAEDLQAPPFDEMQQRIFDVISEHEASFRQPDPRGPLGFLSEVLGGTLATVGALPFEAAKLAGRGAAGGSLAATAGGLDVIGLDGAADAVRRAKEAAKRGISTGSDVALETTGEVFGRAADVVGGVTFGQIAAGRQQLSTGEWWDRYVWPEQGGAGGGRAIADAIGVKPTSPHYESIANLGNIALQLAVGKYGIADPASGLRYASKVPLPAQMTPEFVKGLTKRFGPLGREVILARGKSWEQWLEGRGGNKIADHVMKLNEKYGSAGAIAQALDSEGMPMPLARQVAEAATPEQVKSILVEKTAYDPKLRTEWYRRSKEIEGELTTELPVERQTHLRAEKAVLDRKLENITEVPWRFPKPSAARRIARGVPLNTLESDLARIANPIGWVGQHIPVPHITHVFDNLYESQLYRPGKPGSPPNADTLNTNYTLEVHRRAGVKPAVTRELLDRMTEASKTDTAWRAWARDWWHAMRDSRRIDPAMKPHFGTYHYTAPDQRVRMLYEPPDTPGESRSVLMEQRFDEKGRPENLSRIDASAQTLDTFAGPSIRDILQASSWTQRQIGKVRRTGKVGTVKGRDVTVGKGLLVPYDVARFVWHAMTAVLKPVALTGGYGFRTLPLIQRIQGEQMLRMHFYGFDAFFPKTRAKGGFDLFELAELSARDLGSLLINDRAGPTPYRGFTVSQIERVRQPVGQRQMDDRAARKIWYRAHQVNNSPEIGALLRLGPDEWVNWLDRHPEWKAEVEARVAGTTTPDILTYAKNDYLAYQQLAGGDTALFEAMRSGNWSRKGTEARGLVSAKAQSLLDDYDVLLRQDLTLRDQIRTARFHGNKAKAKAMQLEHKRTLSRLKEIEKRTGRPDAIVRLADEEAFVSAIKDAYTRGEYDAPLAVSGPDFLGDYGQRKSAYWFLDQVNEFLYKPFQLVAKADQRMTRGPLYQQAARESYDRLIAFGYPKNLALEMAKARGKEVTQSIMYDLGAKSSAHHFTRNVFWFAPAFQEMLTTWAVKIPSRYYWPVGAAYLYNQGHNFLEALKEIGFLQVVGKDPEGNDQWGVVIPGLSSWLAKYVPEEVRGSLIMDPESANLATAGGFAPSLSLQGGIGLGYLSRKHGGVWKSLSDQFMQFGTEPYIFPKVIREGWTAITGDPFPGEALLHGDMHQEMFNLGALDSSMMAFVEVKDQMPRQEQFVPENDTEEAKAQADQDYWAAHAKWVQEWEDETHRLIKAGAWRRLLGSTVSPGSWRLTSEYKRDAQAVFKRLYGPHPAIETITDERRLRYAEETQRIINQFLIDHPAGDAFLVPKSLRDTPDSTLPYSSDEDQKYYDGLYTGAWRAKTFEEFAATVQVTESYRYYIHQQERDLNSIGNTAKERLLRWGEVQAVVLDRQEKWNHWRYLNPEANSILADQRRHFASEYGRLPNSYDLEREIQVYQGLKEYGELFTIGGRRDADYRKVLGALREDINGKSKEYQPQTPLAKDISRFFNDVLDKYGKATGPLFEEAEKLANAGGDASGLYDRIDVEREKYNKIAEGMGFPALDDFFWGVLSDADKQDRSYKWATQPPTWLSSFELEKAGYETNDRDREFLKALNKFNDDFWRKIEKDDISTNSNDFDQRNANRLAEIGRVAQRFGGNAQSLANLNEATPIERLGYLNQASAVPEQVWNAYRHVKSTIEREDLSIRSWSDTATEQKRWFFTGLQNMRDPKHKAYDPQFDAWMTNMGFAMRPSGKDQREQILLYNALFFGGFSDQFIPPEIEALVRPGIGLGELPDYIDKPSSGGGGLNLPGTNKILSNPGG